MRIGIVGNGVVGSATGAAFAGHVDEVRYWDRVRVKETHQISDTLDCDIVFVCLPTPQAYDSLGCDLTHIYNFFEYGTPDRFRTANFVLRSTVPIGTTRMLRDKYGLTNLVHSPEFLTARTANEDAANPTRMIIGEPNFTPDSEKTGCADLLQELYTKLFKNEEEATYRIHFMSSDESEAVKLFQNAFSAVKVSAFNEFRSLSDRLGMDWERVLEALLAGGWISPMHTQVPGPDGKRGWGGSCLPKDLNNLISCGADADVAMLMCQAAATRNTFDRGQL